jgi:hypothetical protein
VLDIDEEFLDNFFFFFFWLELCLRSGFGVEVVCGEVIWRCAVNGCGAMPVADRVCEVDGARRGSGELLWYYRQGMLRLLLRL